MVDLEPLSSEQIAVASGDMTVQMIQDMPEYGSSGSMPNLVPGSSNASAGGQNSSRRSNRETVAMRVHNVSAAAAAMT